MLLRFPYWQNYWINTFFPKKIIEITRNFLYGNVSIHFPCVFSEVPEYFPFLFNFPKHSSISFIVPMSYPFSIPYFNWNLYDKYSQNKIPIDFPKLFEHIFKIIWTHFQMENNQKKFQYRLEKQFESQKKWSIV